MIFSIVEFVGVKVDKKIDVCKPPQSPKGEVEEMTTKHYHFDDW